MCSKEQLYLARKYVLLRNRPEQVLTEVFSDLFKDEASLQLIKCYSLETVSLYKVIPAIIAYAGASSH